MGPHGPYLARFGALVMIDHLQALAQIPADDEDKEAVATALRGLQGLASHTRPTSDEGGFYMIAVPLGMHQAPLIPNPKTLTPLNNNTSNDSIAVVIIIHHGSGPSCVERSRRRGSF